MKRIHLLVALVVFLALSGAGCELLGVLDPISPPDWIIGSWSDASGYNEYTFTSDNVVANLASLGTIDFGQLAKDVPVDQYSSSSVYEIQMEEDDVTATYEWVKTSSWTLDYTVSVSGVAFGPIELVKQ